MSMKERLRRKPTVHRARHTAFDAMTEARALAALEAQRGRPTIKPAPAAGKSVAVLLRPLLPMSGMGLLEMRRRWREVVGDSAAKAAWPEKFAAGVLTLKAPGALAPILQQQAPLIMDRLKLAGAQVKSIKIVQGALPKPAMTNVAPLRAPLSAGEEKALADALGGIEDEGLRAALMRLGRAVSRG